MPKWHFQSTSNEDNGPKKFHAGFKSANLVFFFQIEWSLKKKKKIQNLIIWFKMELSPKNIYNKPLLCLCLDYELLLSSVFSTFKYCSVPTKKLHNIFFIKKFCWIFLNFSLCQNRLFLGLAVLVIIVKSTDYGHPMKA